MEKIERVRNSRCHICKGRPSFADTRIWDGDDFTRLGIDFLRKLKTHELKCMHFSLCMKDIWGQSDYTGNHLIEQALEGHKRWVEKIKGVK